MFEANQPVNEDVLGKSVQRGKQKRFFLKGKGRYGKRKQSGRREQEKTEREKKKI